MSKPWTQKQANYLLVGTAAYGIGWLENNTNPYGKKKVNKKRSINAIRCKAYRMGVKGLNSGAKSLKELIETTGYSRTQLFRAQKAVNQKWMRSSKKGNYLITVDQIEEILEWLSKDYWSTSKKLYNCVYCAKEDQLHFSWGLCKDCFIQFRKLCRKYNFTINEELLIKIANTGNKEARALGRKLKRKIAIFENQIIFLLEIINGNR